MYVIHCFGVGGLWCTFIFVLWPSSKMYLFEYSVCAKCVCVSLKLPISLNWRYQFFFFKYGCMMRPRPINMTFYSLSLTCLEKNLCIFVVIACGFHSIRIHDNFIASNMMFDRCHSNGFAINAISPNDNLSFTSQR